MEEIQHIEQETKKSQRATYILIGLVVGLLLFSAAQTFQINGLEGKFIAQGITGAAIQTSAVAAPRTSTAPAMVGGC